MKGRTTFVIAHRLSTVRNATRILVFENGRIVESGSFDELVAMNGTFAGLARAQFMIPSHAPEALVSTASLMPPVAVSTEPKPPAKRRPRKKAVSDQPAEG
jgi:ABC-type multidrug transport system ATPase subunit